MKKVENLQGLILHEDVIAMLQPILWRIEQGYYRELFIEENEQQVTGVGVSWSSSMHPTAKYRHVSSIGEGDELLQSLLKEVKPYNKVVSSYDVSNITSIQLLEKYGFQLLQEGQIVGYIFIHPISKTECEGWFGKSIDFPLVYVLKQQLLELQAAGYTTVAFEIDNTNHFAFEFADFLQLGQKESWNSYMRKY